MLATPPDTTDAAAAALTIAAALTAGQAGTAGSAAGSVLAGVAAMRSTQHQAMPYVVRSYFEDVYFGRRGIIDTLARAHVATPKLLARRASELPYGPTEWPF